MSGNDRKPIRVAIWGATGATGGAVLRQCINDPRVSEIRVFTRRPLAVKSQHVQEVIVEDFLALSHHSEELRNIDAAFWCLGVSQSRVPDEDQYREITHGYVLAAASALCAASPDAVFHFVSGMGADPSGRSRMMWARIKGAAEQDLSSVGFRRLLIWRPALIRVVGGRENAALAEKLGTIFTPILRLIPNMTNSTVDIAKAMIHSTFDGESSGTLHSKDINERSRRYTKALEGPTN